MRIECEVAGLPISIEAEPKEFIEVLKALGCETPKTSARPIPEGAHEEEIEGRLCLVKDGYCAWACDVSGWDGARKSFFGSVALRPEGCSLEEMSIHKDYEFAYEWLKAQGVT